MPGENQPVANTRSSPVIVFNVRTNGDVSASSGDGGDSSGGKAGVDTSAAASREEIVGSAVVAWGLLVRWEGGSRASMRSISHVIHDATASIIARRLQSSSGVNASSFAACSLACSVAATAATRSAAVARWRVCMYAAAPGVGVPRASRSRARLRALRKRLRSRRRSAVDCGEEEAGVWERWIADGVDNAEFPRVHDFAACTAAEYETA